MIGKTVSGYKVLEQLGEGGMGAVYLAEEMNLRRKVALKFLLTKYVSEEGARARFIREAQSAAALNHPNIVTVYGFGEYEDTYYIAMEHVAGQSLDQIIKNHTLSIEEAIDIAMQLCDGLREAHHAGIVHRDIKPRNILLDMRGRVKILDFGIAKLTQAPEITLKGETLGTLHYLSPEQIGNEHVDRRSDIFSLGIVLYEMLTSRRPFKGKNAPAVLHAILNRAPFPLTKFRANVPPILQRIVDKCLEKKQKQRYQHIDDIMSDLTVAKSRIQESSVVVGPVEEVPDEPTQSFPNSVAILCLDLQEANRIIDEDSEHTRRLMAYPITVTRTIVEKFGGSLLEQYDDFLYYQFQQPIDAVECALEVQDTVNGLNREEAPRYKIAARIGVHLGEVIEMSSEKLVDGVNVSAALLPMTLPGGITITESIYTLVNDSPKLQLVSQGAQVIEKLGLNIHLYEVRTGYEQQPVAPYQPKQWELTLDSFREKLLGQIAPGSNKLYLSMLGVGVVALLLSSIFFFRHDLIGGTSAASAADKSLAQMKAAKTPAAVSAGNGAEGKIPEDAHAFFMQIKKLKTPALLDQFLQKEKRAGRLDYGQAERFQDRNDKYVIIIDKSKIYAVFQHRNGRFTNLRSGDRLTSLSDVFKGKIAVWVEVF